MNTEIDIARFRDALKESGIDQSELAKRVGCTPGAINQIASGKTRKSRLLPEISAELGVSLDWLLGQADSPWTSAFSDQLSPSEQSWVLLIRHMHPDDRAALLQIARSLSGKKSDTVHDQILDYRAEK